MLHVIPSGRLCGRGGRRRLRCLRRLSQQWQMTCEGRGSWKLIRKNLDYGETYIYISYIYIFIYNIVDNYQKFTLNLEDPPGEWIVNALCRHYRLLSITIEFANSQISSSDSSPIRQKWVACSAGTCELPSPGEKATGNAGAFWCFLLKLFCAAGEKCDIYSYWYLLIVLMIVPNGRH